MLFVTVLPALAEDNEHSDQNSITDGLILLDDCVDFSASHAHSDEIYPSVIEEENKIAYGADYTMFMRSSLTAAWVEYELEADKYPIFETYFRQNEELAHFTFLWSEDGEKWINAEPTIKILPAESWQWIPVNYSLKNIEPTAKYIRIVFSDKNGVEWSPMIAAVKLAYRTADVLGFVDCVGTIYERPTEMLKCLGLVSGYNSFEYKPYEYVSRAEFAKLNAAALVLDFGAGNAETVFADVKSGHFAAHSAAALYRQGIINGDENGRFNPEDRVTYTEAAKMLVASLGYSAAAEDSGGYPGGYLAVARRLGILKGISDVDLNSGLNRGDAAVMLCNALEAEPVYQSGFGNTAEFEKSGVSMLEYYHNIEKSEGIVTSAGAMSLISGEDCGLGRAVVGGKVYNAERFGMAELLGRYVTLYADAENDKILYAEASHSDVLDISAADYLGMRDGKISYLTSNGDEKNVSIGSSARIVYNGRYMSRAGLTDSLELKSGSMRLIKNSGSAYDTVLVWEYESYIAASGGLLDTKLSDRRGGAFEINSANADEIQLTMYGEEADFKTARAARGDIVSVAASRDGRVIRVDVSAARVTGTVAYIYGANEKADVNGVRYEFTDDFEPIGGEVRTGSEITAYLDINGRIFSAEIAGVFDYAYLQAVGSTDEFGDSVNLRIFTVSGEAVSVTADDKTRLNGTANRVANICALEPQLIRIRMNSVGGAAAIETAKPMQGAVGAGEFSLNFTSDSCKYYGGSMRVFASVYQLGSNTPVFIVPENSGSINKYEAADFNRLYSDFSYKVRLFDVSDEYITGAAVIYEDGSDKRNVDSYDNAAVIRESAVINNADGESCLKISVYIRGREQEIYFDNDGGNDDTNGWINGYIKRDTANGNNPFKKGEVIQYYSDSQSHCRSFRMLLSADAIENDVFYEKNTGDYGALSDENYFSELYSVYGTVSGRFADKILVSVRSGGTRQRTIPLSGAAVYLLQRDRNKLALAAAEDITYGDRVFVRMNYAEATDILIVR